MPRNPLPSGRRTKLCRMPVDVLQMLGGLARAQGKTIPDIGDTVIREAIQSQIEKMPPDVRKRFKQNLAQQPTAA